MKLRVVPASRGVQWVRSGLSLCAKQPLGFVSLLGLSFTLAFLLLVVPVLGPVIVVGAMPLMWLVFMLASRRVMAGQRVTPKLLLEPWADAAQRKSWLQLGGLYALVTLVVMVLAGFLGPDMSALAKAIETAPDGESVLADPTVMQSMWWRLGLSLPVSLAFWHTPALMHWARTPPLKALFFSAVASWRNLGAFVVYGLCWAAIVLLVGLPVQLLAAVLPEPMIVNVVAVALAMWVVAAFYASLYASVSDCFMSDAAINATGTGGPETAQASGLGQAAQDDSFNSP